MSGTGPNPLGAEFQRQLAVAPPRELAAPHEEWHVAIHDVPVGPMRREEVGRKIAASAIDRESLAWREGMDDWLAIKHIPELVALFPALAQPTGSGAHAAPLPPPAAGQLAFAARVDQLPVGGRQHLQTDEYAVPLPEGRVTLAQRSSESPVAGSSKTLVWGPMFAFASGGAFMLAAGLFLGVRVLAPQPSAAPAVTQAAPGPAPSAVRPIPDSLRQRGPPIKVPRNPEHGEPCERDVLPGQPVRSFGVRFQHLSAATGHRPCRRLSRGPGIQQPARPRVPHANAGLEHRRHCRGEHE